MLNIDDEIHSAVTVKEFTEEIVIFLTERPSLDLSRLDWIVRLKLTDRPMKSICNNVSMLNIEGKNSVQTSLKRYEMVFCDGLGDCTKFKARFELRTYRSRARALHL